MCYLQHIAFYQEQVLCATNKKANIKNEIKRYHLEYSERFWKYTYFGFGNLKISTKSQKIA
jgi:hypothetical protein